MRKLGLALALWLASSAAFAQNAGWPPPAGAVAFLGVYNTSPPTLTNGQVGFAQLDSSGNVNVNVKAGSGSGCAGTTGTPCFVNVQNWGAGGSALGAIANYGTSPGAVLVPGVNAFVTNLPSGAATAAAQTGVQTTVAPGTAPALITTWLSLAVG